MTSNTYGQRKYHPVTNGLAERFLQTFKQALRAAATERNLLSWKLVNFLLAYRTTPHATPGETPAMLLMGRNIRTRLDALKPNIRKRAEDKQQDLELSLSNRHRCKHRCKLSGSYKRSNKLCGQQQLKGIYSPGNW